MCCLTIKCLHFKRGDILGSWEIVTDIFFCMFDEASFRGTILTLTNILFSSDRAIKVLIDTVVAGPRIIFFHK